MRRIFFTTSAFPLAMVLLGFLLWPGSEGLAQVKIGENPQLIDSGSLLELESDELVLVLTRVTTLQMNALSPLPGSLVYNTDIGCVHSFNGATWINLCAQGGAGGVSTVPGNAIVDNGGAFYDDSGLQNEIDATADAIEDHVAEDTDMDAQNELTDLALDGNTLRLSNPATAGNEVDLTPILGGGGNPNDELIVDGTVVGNDLIINEGASNQVIIDVSSLAGGGSGSNNTTFEVASGNLSITDGGGTLSVPLTDLGTEDPTNELIADGSVVGTDLIINEGASNQVTIDVSSLATGVNTTFEVDSGNLNLTDGAGTLSVPLTDLNAGGNGLFLDSDGDAGTPGQVLSATATGTDWISPTAAGSPFHAAGKMNQGGITRAFNVLAVNSMGPGDYRVFFTTNASTADYVVQLSLLNTGAASIEVTNQTTSSFTVQIYDNAGTPIDGNWFFSIIDF
ncbi:hypothetical protein FK220_006490 [Flavobacteriaceae bacterium TP-CH-4]|uniref:Uncharacterized protein n=1 Tax=Pelagihabitans pacificus TaxID=2696054 RepID=A0A967ARD8_9FLAO|nr:hypothetical protein [Pelagihabitans pacificus]NHF58979.1 hypothetical protein [Pelagihabitans pacificus]